MQLYPPPKSFLTLCCFKNSLISSKIISNFVVKSITSFKIDRTEQCFHFENIIKIYIMILSA